MYIGALFSKRVTKEAAIAGFFVGLSVSLFWLVFVHVKESAPLGLCKVIFGVDSLGGKSILQQVDPLIIALPLSSLTTIVTSLFTKKIDKKHLDTCFYGVK